jgi:galactonate dehydratase
LQVDAVAHNAFIQEQSLGLHYNVGNDLLDYIENPEAFAFQDGYVTLPDGPGLGITVNEDAVRDAAKQGHHWTNPVWRLDDGAVAEW